MTATVYQFQMPGMGAKPGRRISTPSDFRLDFIKRVKKFREDSGFSQEAICAELSTRVGRTVRPDSYRKYEKPHGRKGALLPHDLIVPFCQLVGKDPFELFTGRPFDLGELMRDYRRRPAA